MGIRYRPNAKQRTAAGKTILRATKPTTPAFKADAPKADLIKAAMQRGLPISGTKAELTARLNRYGR